jgi:UPF0716 protein FxsA
VLDDGGVTRRRFPLWVLLVALVVVPLAEIYVLIQVGQVIGAWWTIVLLVADSLLGGWLIRREGGRAWRALSTSLQSGRMPARELADGALILVGGALMLSPGFVTDLLGILLILPFTRPVARRALTTVLSRRLLAGVVPTGGPAGGGHPWSGPRPGPRTAQGPGPVVRGDVVDDE